MDGIAEEQIPFERVFGVNGLKSGEAIGDGERFGFGDVADGLRELGEFGSGALRGLDDGVLRAEDDLGVDGAAAADDFAEVVLEIGDGCAHEVVHAEHDGDEVRLVSEDVAL
jgi:hypothetical protein